MRSFVSCVSSMTAISRHTSGSVCISRMYVPSQSRRLKSVATWKKLETQLFEMSRRPLPFSVHPILGVKRGPSSTRSSVISSMGSNDASAMCSGSIWSRKNSRETVMTPASPSTTMLLMKSMYACQSKEAFETRSILFVSFSMRSTSLPPSLMSAYLSDLAFLKTRSNSISSTGFLSRSNNGLDVQRSMISFAWSRLAFIDDVYSSTTSTAAVAPSMYSSRRTFSKSSPFVSQFRVVRPSSAAMSNLSK
mmetsp:Transcript_11795/g.30912  ORF Transcript_11795/g.30912 Transcript_11795/m.30912 type:complete len:249 (+) Transcript_11795:1613-2359(+)